MGCSRVECLMKAVYKLRGIVKEMEEKLNMKINSIENDDREIVGNTVTRKEQISETETEQRRLRGGKVTGVKEQGNETNREGRRKSVRQRKCKRVSGDRTTCSKIVEIGGRRVRDKSG